MRLSVDFNNLNSKTDLNLNIEKVPIIPSPTKNIIFVEIEGRDGSLTEDQGTYRDITIPILFNIEDRVNIKEACRQIKTWLLGEITDRELIFSDELDYFYSVKSCAIGDIEREIRTQGRFIANFICEPFLYAQSGKNAITLNQQGPLDNPGYRSEPIIKVYGTGNIDLSINSSVIHLTNVVSYITIDTPMLNAYKDTQPQNNLMNGNFPVFFPGRNNISWTGTVTKLEIIPNWRWL